MPAPSDAPAPGPAFYHLPPPSSDEQYCAWFGEARDGVLYFGESAFWSALRASGDPRAELDHPGPRRIGRFDLDARVMLPPLDVGAPDSRSGSWDVLPRPGPEGAVWFTSYFEEAGAATPSGAVRRFDAGPFLNELAAGPDRSVLATRYADAASGGGAVVVLDEAGRVQAEHRLAAPEGMALAPKTPAWDPVAREIWVTTDLLPVGAGRAAGLHPHPTLVLDEDGRPTATLGSPGETSEIQFVRFREDGHGYWVRVDGRRLELLVLAPDARPRRPEAARVVVLDDAFARLFDFAQDVQPTRDGGVVVTRWSGHVHAVSAAGEVRTVVLPRRGEDGLYYTAVRAGDDVCATLCAGVEVVCAPLPDPEPAPAGQKAR